MLATIAKRLGHTPFARQALLEESDLSAFQQRPTPRIILGLVLIAFSYVIGWPAVGAMGALALSMNKPWIGVVGGPLVYGLSHLVFLLGMILAGTEYTKHFLKWMLRLFIEKYHPLPLPISPTSTTESLKSGKYLQPDRSFSE